MQVRYVLMASAPLHAVIRNVPMALFVNQVHVLILVKGLSVLKAQCVVLGAVLHPTVTKRAAQVEKDVKQGNV